MECLRACCLPTTDPALDQLNTELQSFKEMNIELQQEKEDALLIGDLESAQYTEQQIKGLEKEIQVIRLKINLRTNPEKSIHQFNELQEEKFLLENMKLQGFMEIDDISIDQCLESVSEQLSLIQIAYLDIAYDEDNVATLIPLIEGDTL